MCDNIKKMEPVLRKGWCTVDEIAEATGLTRHGVCDTLYRLVNQGYVEKSMPHKPGTARRYRWTC